MCNYISRVSRKLDCMGVSFACTAAAVHLLRTSDKNMFAPSLVSMSDLQDTIWFGAERSTRDLRIPKSHLDGGEPVYAKKATGDKTTISTIFREWNHPADDV